MPAADVNERYRAKVQARRDETVEVKTYPAAPHHPTATDGGSVDGRFQAKLLAHQGQPSDLEKVEAARVAELKEKQAREAGKAEAKAKADEKARIEAEEKARASADKEAAKRAEAEAKAKADAAAAAGQGGDTKTEAGKSTAKS